MKRVGFVFALLIVGAMAFAQVPIFLNVNIEGQGAGSSSEIMTDMIIENLHASDVAVTAGGLNDSDTVEFLVRGLTVVYQGEHIAYSMAVGVVFHDPALVNQSYITNITCNPNTSGIIWASERSVDFFVGLVQRAGLAD